MTKEPRTNAVVLPAILLLTLIMALTLSACDSATEQNDAPVTSWDSKMVFDSEGRELGAVAFPTSCTEAANTNLEHGLALLHHMTYLEAELMFQAASEADPDCALAYWGQAMTFLHPLWPDVVPGERLVKGRELLDRAASSANVSAREQAYIQATAAYFYKETATEPERLAGFSESWTAVADEFPLDPEARLFHALALLATAPAANDPIAIKERAGAITEAVLREIPDHPGAHHYTIHAYDVPQLAERALSTARRYGEVAPENSHALHMTSHIFTRRGLWPESIAYNRRAADAARERTPTGDVSMHLLHALDYLAYAHLQRGDDALAKTVLDDLEGLEPPFQDHGAVAYAFAAVPARYALERRDWDAASSLTTGWPSEVAWSRYPHLQALTYFARGLGAARTGNPEAAAAASSKLEELQKQASDSPGAYDWGTQVVIQRLTVDAWSMWSAGNRDEALETMQMAATLEADAEKNPVTPGEVLPAQELYGDMLSEAGQLEAAVTAYEVALERSPNRYWSLLGAFKAATAAGNKGRATEFSNRLLEVVSKESERKELQEIRH